MRREIRYICALFPYDIGRSHNRDMLYMQGILLAGEVGPDKTRDPVFHQRLINLITGLELLSIGTSFHGFKASGSDISKVYRDPAGEKGYTLDLLFGDIFYSRAVIYLLRYRDHKVFDRILEALKKLHESRLDLHLGIRDVIKGKSDPAAVFAGKHALIDANRLLYIAIETGRDIYGQGANAPFAGDYLEAVKKLLTYKTCGELLTYLHSFSEIPLDLDLKDQLASRRKKLLHELEEFVSRSHNSPFAGRLDDMLGSLHKS